jgi:hypothetical protein
MLRAAAAAAATEHSSRQIGYPLLALTIMAAPACKPCPAMKCPYSDAWTPRRGSQLASEEDVGRRRDGGSFAE